MTKIDIILDVYETHSISKTAARLSYTQSAVSQAIRSYEKEIGITLFKRSKSGMTPLSGTDSIFSELKAIQASQSHIEQIAAKINGLESGVIRIGTVQSIAYHWLPGILKKFTAEYPNITFQLYVDGFQELSARLKEGTLDCIFTSKYSAGDLPCVVLGEDEDYTVIKMVEQGFGIAILPKLLLYNIPFNVCVRPFTEHYKRILVAAYSPTTVEPTPALQHLWLSQRIGARNTTLYDKRPPASTATKDLIARQIVFQIFRIDSTRRHKLQHIIWRCHCLNHCKSA